MSDYKRTECGDAVVLYDADSDIYPIGITVDGGDEGWLSNEDAEAVVRAMCEHLPKAPHATEHHAVLASQVSFNEGLLRLAAVHGKTVTFRYAKGDGSTIEQRTLQPSEVKTVDGKVLFIGFDPDRDEPRSYRVDRMKGEVSVA